MSDHPSRRSRRPDSKSMWDESDRRGARDRDPERDRRDDRRRRDGHDDRSRRYRSRSRNRRDRYRSRSRDRDKNYERLRDNRDRDYVRDRRDRGPGGDRDESHPRGGRHDRNRGEPGRRTREGDEPLRRGMPIELPERGRRSKHPNASLETDRPQGDNTTGRRRSASPDRRDNDVEHTNSNSPLPSRPKSERSEKNNKEAVPHAPVSFKVGGHENGHNHGRSKSTDYERRTPEKDYGRSDGEPMEEDDYDDPVVEEDGDMAAMQAMLGFGGFETTKNKKVIGNNAGGVRKEKKTEYRQYMNRIGGFNRPLSPTRQSG
ncbi:hypothetical protein MKZ38_004081 [Zalerion maritima]|uniref:U4/U6.U5 small nuclear ribonucleoprotein 27kDa protein domain-containing protein n=1 Tax=Zalerion maritima TaxID=339359 RepID=A0AAD5WXG6_9PEZI|nr:hypothetical protein MKZ38_004081 [Zalerion maritima]